MPASVPRGSQTNYRLIPQCPGYQHYPKETARAHTELREGSRVPPYKDKGTALEYSKSEGVPQRLIDCGEMLSEVTAS